MQLVVVTPADDEKNRGGVVLRGISPCSTCHRPRVSCLEEEEAADETKHIKFEIDDPASG